MPKTCFDLNKTTRYVAPYKNEFWKANIKKMDDSCRCKSELGYYNLTNEPYVYYPKCPKNCLAALRIRQVSAREKPCKSHLKAFDQFVDQWFKFRQARAIRTLIGYACESEDQIEEYFKTLDPPKQAEYREGYEKLQEIGRVIKTCHVMVKNNEIHLLDGDSRPRLIFSPSSTLKCMGSFIARLLIRLMKEDFMMGKAFVSGVKDEDFKSDLQ